MFKKLNFNPIKIQLSSYTLLAQLTFLTEIFSEKKKKNREILRRWNPSLNDVKKSHPIEIYLPFFRTSPLWHKSSKQFFFLFFSKSVWPSIHFLRGTVLCKRSLNSFPPFKILANKIIHAEVYDKKAALKAQQFSAVNETVGHIFLTWVLLGGGGTP